MNRDERPLAVLDALGIKYRKTGRTEVRFDCPECGSSEGFDLSTVSGRWRCKRASCSAKGDLYALRVALGAAYRIASVSEPEDTVSAEEMDAFVRIESELERMHRFLCQSPAAEAAREYLRSRGLSAPLWAHARLGWYPRVPKPGDTERRIDRHGLVGIPYLVPGDTRRARAIKLRWIPPEPNRDGKPWRYTRIAGGESCLFAPLGIDSSPNVHGDIRTVLLVGGELDALACVQALLDAGIGPVDARELIYWTPVSVPDGEGAWSDALSDELASAEDIVIALDNDAAGQAGAEAIAKALGRWRCRLGRWPEGANDANAALVAGGLTRGSIETLVRTATPLAGEGVKSASTLAARAVASARRRGARGWPTGLADLDALIGGWRPGEITVVTAMSGAGKTTFCVQAMLEQLSSGRRVLAVPLEGGPDWLLGTKVARYVAGRDPLELSDAEHELVISELGDRLLLLDHSGQVDVEAFSETVKYAVERLGVGFIVIDHLSFAVARDRERWSRQNALIMALQLVIQRSDAHMLLVVHPRKVSGMGADRDDVAPQMSDLKGESEVFQDLANVLALYRPRTADRTQFVDGDGMHKAALVAMKQRSEHGSEGCIELRFDKSRGRFLDSKSEFDVFTTPKPEPNK